MKTTNPDSVYKEVTIHAARERVFAAFTARMDEWWPRSHHIGKTEMKEAVLEGRAGGRWFERDADGSECTWGKVLVWEPPTRLVLGWQLTAEWQYDPNFLTEVEVLFLAEGPGVTRLTLEHKGMEKFGAKAAEVWKAFDSEGGWGELLKALAKLGMA